MIHFARSLVSQTHKSFNEKIKFRSLLVNLVVVEGRIIGSLLLQVLCGVIGGCDHMRNLRVFAHGHGGYSFGIVNALLAIGLALLSLTYVRPRDCSRLCEPPEPLLCGTCEIGEQKAGWPLPFFVDMPGGGSPVSGWGRLGPEDLPNPVTFILDVLFYSILLWPISYILQVVRGKKFPLGLIVLALPLTAILAAFLWLIYILFGPFRYA